MTRDHVDYNSNGAVRGSGALAGSASAFDHHEHRQELFGGYRDDLDEPEPDDREWICPHCDREFDGMNAWKGHVSWCENRQNRTRKGQSDEEKAAIYVEYWTTEKRQKHVAEEFGCSQSTVGRIARREREHHRATEEVAERLGHPEERDWDYGQPRKVEP